MFRALLHVCHIAYYQNRGSENHIIPRIAVSQLFLVSGRNKTLNENQNSDHLI